MVKLNKRVLHSQIYDIIKERIIKGYEGYEPGSRCSITEIAEELDVSVTPVKEAFKKLENDSLVEMHPRSGTYIKKINKEDFKQVIVVRKGLEKMIIDLINPHKIEPSLEIINKLLNEWEKNSIRKNIPKVSEKHINFHKELIKLTENQVLINLYQELINRSSLYIAYHSNEYILEEEEINLHKEILISLKKFDKNKFEELIDLHFKRAEDFIMPKLND